MEYIVKDAGRPEPPAPGEPACIFCRLLRAEDGPENLILFRGDTAFVVMNKFPYSNGHLMVVPYRHVDDFGALGPEEGGEMFALAQKCVASLRERLAAQGFNLGLNIGRTAGAGIDDHIHLHVVPRWEGDHNFMPVLSDVRVIPEHMETTYNTLRPAFQP